LKKPRKEPKRASNGHGGRRSGAGRRRGLPWGHILKHALLGASDDEITAALGISPEELRGAAVMIKFRSLVDRARARHQLRIRKMLDLLARRGTRGRSVTAAVALAKHGIPNWEAAPDRNDAAMPNTEGAVLEVDRMLQRMFGKGRPRSAEGNAR
jgi:hypothetical protein